MVGAATPILLAALGELVVEKSGVLNLGVEGMMLIGAVTGFAVTSATGVSLLGLVAAMLAAVAASLIFGFLTLTLASNQVATGLALTIFGIGLSSLIGESFVGTTIAAASARSSRRRWREHPILRLVFGYSPARLFLAGHDRRGRLVPQALARRADPARGRRERPSRPIRSAIR